MSNSSSSLLDLKSVGKEDFTKYDEDSARPNSEQRQKFLKQDCQHRKKIAAFRDGILDPSKTVYLKKHIAACPVCKETSENHQKVNVIMAQNIPNVGMEITAIEDVDRELKELTKMIYEKERKFKRKNFSTLNEIIESIGGKFLTRKFFIFFLISSITLAGLMFALN